MKVGLVLSGGGARGIAHLGVIQALIENNIKIDIISGTSAGSIIGALYSYGYSPNEILEITEDTNVVRLLRPALSFTGLIKMDGLGQLLLKYMPEGSFEALKIPLIISATNINVGKPKYFDSGDLIAPIMASSCIPIIFNHITIDGVDYVDGGITDNFPIDPIRKESDLVIGSHTNFIAGDFNDFNMKSLLERTMLIAISGNVYPKKEQCDLFIDPPKLGNYNGFDIRRSKQIYSEGYEFTCSLLERNPDLLGQLVSTR